MSSVRGFLGGALVTGLVLVVLMMSAMIVGHFLGYRMIIITSGSMEPTIPVGSLVIGVPTGGDQVSVGDVVVMQEPGQARVTHRVTELARDGSGALLATTKGDNNENLDPLPYRVPDEALLAGPVVPGAGSLVAWLGSASARFALAALVAVGLVGAALWKIWFPSKPTEGSAAPSSAGDDPAVATSA